jgi:hypothetical protein
MLSVSILTPSRIPSGRNISIHSPARRKINCPLCSTPPPEFAQTNLPTLRESDIYTLAKNKESAPFFAALAKVLYKEEHQRVIVTRQQTQLLAQQAEQEAIEEDESEPTLPLYNVEQGESDNKASQSTYISNSPVSQSQSDYHSTYIPSSQVDEPEDDLDREKCEVVTQTMFHALRPSTRGVRRSITRRRVTPIIPVTCATLLYIYTLRCSSCCFHWDSGWK